MKEHFDFLGFKVRDVVSGFKGVVTSISFDLYGCVQAVVTPEINKDDKKAESRWFDTKRLIKLSKEPVMAVPTFGAFAEPPARSFAAPRGGQDLPQYPEKPL